MLAKSSRKPKTRQLSAPLILSLDAFIELDAFILMGVLNRIKRPRQRAILSSPTQTATSMNGMVLCSQSTLAKAFGADVVLIGSGKKIREFSADEALLPQLRFDPTRQTIGAQCSGILLLAKLGLLDGIPACTDLLIKRDCIHNTTRQLTV